MDAIDETPWGHISTSVRGRGISAPEQAESNARRTTQLCATYGGSGRVRSVRQQRNSWASIDVLNLVGFEDNLSDDEKEQNDELLPANSNATKGSITISPSREDAVPESTIDTPAPTSSSIPNAKSDEECPTNSVSPAETMDPVKEERPLLRRVRRTASGLKQVRDRLLRTTLNTQRPVGIGTRLSGVLNKSRSFSIRRGPSHTRSMVSSRRMPVSRLP